MKTLTLFTLTACAFTGAAFAQGTTYWAWGGGPTRGGFSYDWNDAKNWRMDAAGTIAATTCPQEGDTAYFSTGTMMTAGENDSSPALSNVIFTVASTIHQGNVQLLAGGGGLKMDDAIKSGMGWWAGLWFKGTGEVPIYVPTGKYFDDQKGVAGSTTAILVKRGGGSFNTCSEGLSQWTPYKPCKTILEGGTFKARIYGACAGHEFVWAENDGNLRLHLTHFGNADRADNDYNQKVFPMSWTIRNGSMTECEEMANTTHGITSDVPSGNVGYLILDGTPKIAEHRFTGQLYGTGGIAFRPWTKQEGGSDYVFTIAKSASTAGGGLSVTNGTMQLTEGATFANLGQIEVGEDGTFRVAEGSGKNFTCQKLVLAGNGKLKLEAGVHLQFLKAIKDGEALAVNTTYTAANADWIEGEGSVDVAGAYQVDPIALTVGEGVTQTLEDALAAYNEAHAGEEGFSAVTIDTLNGGVDKGRTIVKQGDGTLSLVTAISGFTGSWDVQGGVVDCKAQYAFGADTTSAIVNVRDGATVLCALSKEVQTLNVNRTFHIAGNGYNNQGALRGCNTHLNYGQPNAYGGYFVLEGDATVYTGPWEYAPNDSITLNGHTLTFKSSGGADRAVFFKRVLDDGKIVFDGIQPRHPGVEIASANAGNVFEMKNYGGWRFWGSQITGAGKAAWTYLFNGGECRVYGDMGVYQRDAANNSIYGPVEITKGTTVSQICQGNTAGSTLILRGAVSGEGDLLLGDNGEPKYLHLVNPANTFSGKVRVNRGVAYVYGPGTLPKAATLKLERTHTYGGNNKEATLPPFYGAGFMSAETLDLGACELTGSFIGRVQGGLGAFTDMTKTGTGTVEYYSQLGAATLKVEGGVFKLPRGAAPGLWEGVADYADATKAAEAFETANPAATYVMTGPNTANAIVHENYTASADKRVIVYTGYVWNRTAADVTATLVSSVNGPVQVKVDGEVVLSASEASLVKKQITLTPGAHAFEYRSRNGSPRETGWAKNLGFAVDVTGSADPGTNACVRAVDPGDGSFFTRSTSDADLPKFGAIRVGAGGALDLNGTTYTAEAIGGAGVVTNSAATEAKLVVKAVTVDASADETLTSLVPVELAEGFTVSVANAAKRIHKGHVALKATAGIKAPAGVIPVTSDDGTLWTASLSADGTTLNVTKAGLMIYLK